MNFFKNLKQILFKKKLIHFVKTLSTATNSLEFCCLFSTGIATSFDWSESFESCKELIASLKISNDFIANFLKRLL